jgi:alkaline phosphatase
MSRYAVIATFLLLLATEAGAQTKPAKAKNIILFLADAGGIPTLNAASWYAYGAPQKLHVQSWPHVGLSDTSPSVGFVTDSANGMTAIVTGVKTRNGVISQGPEAVRGTSDGQPLKTILEYAEDHGLLTGVVTDQAITDATPAACYAHSNDRNKWADIFSQAFEPRFGDGVDVLIGAGRKEIETQLTAKGGSIAALAEKGRRPVLASVEEATIARKRPIVVGNSVDVRAAALRALSELQTSRKGYFLMVEWDSHTPDPKAGLDHVVALDRLVKEIESKVDLKDTLLIFTADHSFALRTRGEGSAGAILDGYDEWKASGVKARTVQLKSLVVDDAHTGEEVAAMALGAGSERVSGFFPNTRLFHVMMDAWGFKSDDPVAGKSGR